MTDIVEYLAQKGIVCSKQQREAILSGERDTLLLAVPGSGKTTVLVSRIAQMLLFEHYKPEEIVAFTYNRAAARDIGKRFESLFGSLVETPPRFSTVHSMCYTVLRKYAATYGRTVPTLLDGSSYELRPQTLLREALFQQTKDFFSAEQIDDLLAKIGCAVNRMLPAEQLKEIKCGCSLDLLAKEYHALKQQKGVMDYDDMQLFALQILNRLPQFRKSITASWKWIFLDEAQDASLLQHKLISVLSQGKNVFFVGDEDQTIYDFRGASPKKLLDFQKEHPESRLLRLETNYRCPADLVSAADLFIRYNQNRYPKNMTAFRKETDSIDIRLLKDYNEQTDEIVSALAKLPKDRTAAVLASHNVSLLSVAMKLDKLGIPYYRRDSDFRFSSNPAVRGFIQLLQYAADPKDADAFEAAAKVLWFRKADIAQMGQYLHRFPNGFYSGMVCELSKYEKKHAADAANGFSLMQKQSGEQIYHTVMDNLRYESCLAGRGKSPDELTVGNALAMYQLRMIAKEAKNLPMFLYLLAETERFEREGISKGRSRITLGTVHGAKGLEFDEVYLTDVIEGALPALEDDEAPAAQKKETLEGQTRLFYVAVTRAKKKLTLYTANTYWEKPVAPSRFILRISKQKANFAKRVRHKAFGIGEILSVKGDTANVAFERGIKTLQLDYCLENGILSWVNEK